MHETQDMHKKRRFCVYERFKHNPFGLKKAVIFPYLLGNFDQHWLKGRIKPN